MGALSDIFPIEEVVPVEPDASDMMLDHLAEAMRTSYIHGRSVSWIRITCIADPDPRKNRNAENFLKIT